MPESLFFTATAEDFKKIPGSPVAYWVSDKLRSTFASTVFLKDIGEPRLGMATGNNDIYLRLWHEVAIEKIGFRCTSRKDALLSKCKWFPYNKGGDFRRWYGNNEFVVNWENDGELLRTTLHPSGNRIWAHNFNLEYIFRPCLTFTSTSSSYFGIRYSETGFLFDNKGSSYFTDKHKLNIVLGLLASKATSSILKAINPTIEFQPGNISIIPFNQSVFDVAVDKRVQIIINRYKEDWNFYETSWDFQSLPLLRPEYRSHSLPAAYTGVRAAWQAMTEEMQRLEEENNRVFIEAYGLQDELTPDVPLKEITLTCNPFYRYGVDAEQADAATRTALEDRLRADSVKELLSYAIGCMMGRYSLDAAGLVYAAAGNAGFDADKYTTFPADEDGIVPLGDMPWFDDDAAHRFREFCLAAWGEESLEENLRFVADQLDPKRGETPEATIRRWLSSKFFKDWHCKVYKKRPIYWLFSSGKHKAFECLVYLHRFNSNTLPRMRAAYVTPLQGKIAARLELLEREEAGAGSTSSRSALKKQRELLLKKQDELRHFDDLLRHYADQNIQLDLDDGVKVNYAKLADLLAESKTITGGKEE